MAAFNVFLFRYTGQTDLVVGTPISARNLAELEPLIGFFLNTLAIRTDMSGDPTFREVLEQMKRKLLAGFANQDVPFEKIVEELEPQRSTSYNPVFQTMLVVQNVPSVNWPGLTVTSAWVGTRTAKFDFSLYMAEEADGLRLTAEYNTDLFEANTIQRCLKHFETLLWALANAPDEKISTLEMLDAEEKAQLLIASGYAEMPQARPSVHDFFEEQAERIPNGAAVLFQTEVWTYGQLDVRANQIAHYLRDRGVGPESLIGIYMRRQPWMLAAILGVLKAGAAYVPLDPNYPDARTRAVLESAQAKLILSHSEMLKALPSGGHDFVPVDGAGIATKDSSRLRVAAQPSNLAYVLFTSGSTGQPKGVAIEHRSAAAFIAWT